MLLTKSCHDLDWLSYVVGSPTARVLVRVSFAVHGGQQACRRRRIGARRAPSNRSAPTRRWRCITPDSTERSEAYFTEIVAPEMTPAAVDEALRTGPYGRCVFASDNDVVDHQVVSLEYANGVTAAFTLTAATRHEDRRTSIFGSRGQITTDGTTVEVYDFRRAALDDLRRHRRRQRHGGGDAAMLSAFLDALRLGEPDAVLVTRRSQPRHPPRSCSPPSGPASPAGRRALTGPARRAAAHPTKGMNGRHSLVRAVENRGEKSAVSGLAAEPPRAESVRWARPKPYHLRTPTRRRRSALPGAVPVGSACDASVPPQRRLRPHRRST